MHARLHLWVKVFSCEVYAGWWVLLIIFPMFLIVGVDDYSSESDVIIIPSALDFISQDEMLTPLGRLDKYVTSENIFNRYTECLQ